MEMPACVWMGRLRAEALLSHISNMKEVVVPWSWMIRMSCVLASMSDNFIYISFLAGCFNHSISFNVV